MFQHVEEAYLSRRQSCAKKRDISSTCRFKKKKNSEETVQLVQVSDFHDVFVTENCDTVVDVDDNKETEIDETNYFEE